MRFPILYKNERIFNFKEIWIKFPSCYLKGSWKNKPYHDNRQYPTILSSQEISQPAGNFFEPKGFLCSKSSKVLNRSDPMGSVLLKRFSGVGARSLVAHPWKRVIPLPASVARQNSRWGSAARKNAVRASSVENWSTVLRGSSAAGTQWLFLLTFFIFFFLLYSTYVY